MIRPTVLDFKQYFDRDFPYGYDMESVRDKDITKAFNDAGVSFNEDLFADQSTYTIAFLNLSAHYLVMNLRSSSQGLTGQYAWLQSSKSVGSISESFTIPQRILDNPEFAMLTKTNYGAKYIGLMLPMLVGQIFLVEGGTQA
jgi:hypothetical protein